MDYVRDENGAVFEKNFSSSITFGNGDSEDYWDYYLNNTWYNSITQNYKNMLVEGTYYLGHVGPNVNYKSTICTIASNTVTIKDCEKTTNIWTGYVGIPIIGEMFASQQTTDYTQSEYMWLMTPSSSLNLDVVATGGYGNYYSPTEYKYVVRPSITLNSAVKIIGGTGLKNDPFEISL